VEEAVKRAVEALAVLESEAADAAPAAADPEAIRELLDRLEPLLAAADTEALSVVEELRAAARGGPHETAVADLERAVEEFDFDAAQAALATLRAAPESGPPGR
jgi:hypothetical protein